ncbi:methyl-galactoside transport system substrate-binding protein [Moryella indoligenes]|uniref:D-galactose/methyl-galactoside binding periplasmic protein MglB n=1 Tax=Moryella indoligenes TaxID=371674 RepID=A0AAE3VBE8_9FIRM|nr:galactose ABC transporter substrate-binding protein [Moryella indoligenes]MDQ0153184.1 methyl-galactoside transport system substrate-binding protein [Moryella indoligenes]
MDKDFFAGKGFYRRAVCLLLLFLFCLTGCGESAETQPRKIRIGVTLYDQYDTFISELMMHFNEQAALQQENITLEILNAAKSQQTQNRQVQKLIEDGCDVICVNLVDRTAPTKIIDMAKKNSVPVIFFNRELVEEDLLRWDRLYYVGADAFESGILEGQIAAERCNTDPSVDRNGDGSIQYIVLEGEVGHQDAIVRTEYCVNTLLDQGVPLEKLGYVLANWNRMQAQTQVSQMVSEYGEAIEMILSNNDDMALGAIDAYKNAEIPEERRPIIVGIDGTEPGLRAVKQGEMIGTVYNDGRGQAEAMFALCLSVAGGTELQDYELIDGKYIRLPYQKITPENVDCFRREE